jgi:large subunit ribosomal protein L13
MKIYNGENLILGRLAGLVAKSALMGEEVKVVNCDKVIISGKKVNTFNFVKERRARKGYPLKSAKHIRLSERYVKRSIRGMLPWKLTRGREAFKRIRCYPDIPSEFAGKDYVKVEKSSVEKLPNLKYVTVKEICKHVGGK